MIKTHLILAVAFIAGLTSFQAEAGTKTGNGGGAWVCRDKANSILWIQLVDLFEAWGDFNLTLTKFNSPYEVIVEQVKAKMLEGGSAHLNKLSPFIDELNDLKEGSQRIIYTDDPLPIIEDAYYMVPPFGPLCEEGKIRYEQVVRYDDGGPITVQRQLFNALSDGSRAALVIHEGTYAYRRGLGDRNSSNTRKIVGLAFSTISAADFGAAIEPLYSAQEMEIPPGSYYVWGYQTNWQGSYSNMLGARVSISGSFANDPSHSNIERFSGTIGEGNVAQILIPNKQNGAQLSRPSIEVDLNDQAYSGVIAQVGWSTDLLPLASTPTLNKVYCETRVTGLPDSDNPGVISIVCTQL